MDMKQRLADLEYKLFQFFETEDADILNRKFSKFAEMDIKDPQYAKLEKALKAEITDLGHYLLKY